MSAKGSHYISYASVEPGDRITVETRVGDVKNTATAVVGRVQQSGSNVVFYSVEGNAFGSFRRGSRALIILHDRAPKYDPPPLFDLERLVS